MTRLAPAISAVCASLSGGFQPNSLVWNEPRWSNGRM
jgi:hypothetical protein